MITVDENLNKQLFHGSTAHNVGRRNLDIHSCSCRSTHSKRKKTSVFQLHAFYYLFSNISAIFLRLRCSYGKEREGAKDCKVEMSEINPVVSANYPDQEEDSLHIARISLFMFRYLKLLNILGKTDDVCVCACVRLCVKALQLNRLSRF